MAAPFRTMVSAFTLRRCAIATAIGGTGISVVSVSQSTSENSSKRNTLRSITQFLQPKPVACEGENWIVAGVAGVAAIAGGYYMYNKGVLTDAARDESATKLDVDIIGKIGSCDGAALAADPRYQKAMESRAGQSPTQLIEIFQPLADEGHALAQFQLGVAYESMKSPKTAFRWFHQAAEQGFDEALVEVGVHYDMGKGVTQDVSKANAYFSKAYAGGNAKGAFLLSWSFANGEGVEKDVAKAIELLQFVEKESQDPQLIRSATTVRARLETQQQQQQQHQPQQQTA